MYVKKSKEKKIEFLIEYFFDKYEYKFEKTKIKI